MNIEFDNTALERGMTQKQLSAETGIKASVLSETINGKRSVSLSVAIALEKALDIPADIWMNMLCECIVILRKGCKGSSNFCAPFGWLRRAICLGRENLLPRQGAKIP